MQLFSPSTVEEAVHLMTAAPMPLDSPTQRRIRDADALRPAFAAERRRPQWVWAAREGDDVLGVCAAFGHATGRVLVLDLFGLPSDPGVARELVAHASREAMAGGCEEAGIFAPPGTSYADLPQLADPLEAAGWRLLVERRHYEFVPPRGLGDDIASDLTLHQVTDPGDPDLAAVHREVMRETLDAHDRLAIERLGFEAACVDSLTFILDSDPVECIRLARDPDGELVGMVSGVIGQQQRGFVLFVGVAHAHRGHGYGRQLLALMTRQLLADGATLLIADTDNGNVPMARGFADVGWPQTETRIDLVPVS